MVALVDDHHPRVVVAKAVHAAVLAAPCVLRLDARDEHGRPGESILDGAVVAHLDVRLDAGHGLDLRRSLVDELLAMRQDDRTPTRHAQPELNRLRKDDGLA